MNGLSAHADRDGLLANFRGLERKPRVALIVHSEMKPAEAFRASLGGIGFNGVIPERGQKFEV